MGNETNNETSRALQQILPNHLKSKTTELESIINGLIDGTITVEQAQEYISGNQSLKDLLVNLNDKQISTSKATVLFGENSQTGDIHINDVIGRDSIKLSITINQIHLVNPSRTTNTPIIETSAQLAVPAETESQVYQSHSSLPVARSPKEPLRNHEFTIISLKWSPNGKYLASADYSGHITIWDWRNQGENITSELVTRSERGLFGQVSITSEVFVLAWSADSNYIATSSDDGFIRIWHVNSGKLVTQYNSKSSIKGLVWHRDGNSIIVGCQDCTIRQWDIHDWKLLTEETIAFFRWMNAPIMLTLSTDNRSLATYAQLGSTGLGTLQVRDASKISKTLAHFGFSGYKTAALSANGEMLAASDLENSIQVFDVWNEKLLIKLNGHIAAILNLSFSADNNWLVSKALDNTVCIWNCHSWKCERKYEEAFALMYNEPLLDRYVPYSQAIFHPQFPILATVGETGRSIYLREIEAPNK